MTTKKQPTSDDRFTHPDSESEILRDPEASVYDKILSIIGEDSTVADEVLLLNVICMPQKDISADCTNQILL